MFTIVILEILYFFNEKLISEIIFPATKKKIKDDHGGKFAEISEKVQSGVFYFHKMLMDNVSPLYLKT
jgi:hypothetical protein